MDTTCLDHVLTKVEELQFEQDGYLIIEDALSEEQVDNLTTAVDRVAAIYRPKFRLGSHDLVHVRDFAGKDPQFLELLTWYRTFPKVWDVLGWHIQHSRHMDIMHWQYNGKIVITTYGFLAPTSSAEEILWEKATGFSHRSGIFWDAISIETRGQTAATITCLSRDDSKKIRDVLYGLEK